MAPPPETDPASWEGIDWAVGTRAVSTVSGVLNAVLMLVTLKEGQLGFYLVANNLLMIFQVSDLGASGYLTARARGGLDPAHRAWAALLGAAGPVLFTPFLFAAGLHFLKAQAGLWLAIVAVQAATFCILPLICLADGLGFHRRAWRLMFLIELVTGLALAAGLLTGSAARALAVVALARAVLALAMVKGLLAMGGISQALALLRGGLRDAWNAWRREALPFQAAFFWINLTGFIPLRLVVPFIYQFQGPRAGAMAGIAMQMAGAAHNVATGFSLGALGRLSVEFAKGRAREFAALLRRTSLAATGTGAVLLLAAAAVIEAARHAPWAAIAARVPDLPIYLPLFLAHFLLIAATCPAVALRSTGRDTSAPWVGLLGLLAIPACRAAAVLPHASAVPLALATLALVSWGEVLRRWAVRKSELKA